MKKIIILFGIILTSLVVFAQDIATARLQGIGATVTVTGVVTNGDELGPIRYIQDSTAGLALYDPTPLSAVVRGEEITVTGVLVDYNGLMEMTPVNTLSVSPFSYTVSPQVVTPNQIGENTESELVQIDNVIFNGGGSTFTSGTHDFISNGQLGRVYIRTGSPLENSLIPIGPVTLIGISSQYTFSTPANDGYQILPRDSADIIQSGNIVFTSAVTQTNITTTSFDLTWDVSNISTANCDYGSTPALGTVINQGGSNITHTISLTGLQPATFYYVKCYSVNGSDTAFSNTGIYSTASLSSGKIIPYFNHYVDLSFSNGVDAQNISSNFSDTISAFINRAQSTLDICVYNASDGTIANAINDAYNRGVQVRYIADDDAMNIMLQSLNPNIPIIYRDPSPAGIMHNKFIIIDVNSVDNSWVMGGSCNWSNPANLINDYNNIIFIQDQALAKAYTIEFEEMWGGVFGTHKTDNTPHKFIVDGKEIELYFSPSDQTTSKILNFIEQVDHSLEFALLSFTRDDLGDAVINKDIEFNVYVRGILESQNTTGSEYDNLINGGVNVRSHMGVTHQLHHKYAIADANFPSSRPSVLTGSHNWSSNAENNSDENTLIIYDAEIANIYLQEFERRWCELDPAGSPCFLPSNIDNIKVEDVLVLPNPSSGMVKISSFSPINEIKIYSVDGRYLYSSYDTDIKFVNRGIYFVEIFTNEGKAIKKVIIK